MRWSMTAGFARGFCGKMVQKTVHVLAFDGETVTLRAGAKGAPFTLPVGDLLSCDYARGDHGED